MRALALFLTLLVAAPALAGCVTDGLLDRLRDAPVPAWPATVPAEAPPPLPAEWQAALNASAPVLDALPWAELADATDPLAFGLTFQELGNRSVREFQFAALHAQPSDDAHDSSFHAFGHPAFNRAVARVPVTFTNDAGLALSGEIVLPRRGTEPPHGSYPAVVAFEGIGGNLEMYRWWHAALAEAGFIVFAFDFTGQGHSEGSGDSMETWDARVSDASRAIDFLVNESPVAAWVDSDRIGTVGHSMGAITALEHAAVDARVKATVAAAPIGDFAVGTWPRGRDEPWAALTIPVMLQTGDHDGPIAPVPFMNPVLVADVYAKLQGDKALVVTEAASHGQHTNYPAVPTPTWSRPVAERYSVAWMAHHLAGNASARGVITEGIPHLSALHESRYRLGNESGTLQSGVVPAPPAPERAGELVAREGARAWRVQYALTLDEYGRPRLDADAVPLTPGAEAVRLAVAAPEGGRVSWALTVDGVRHALSW